MSLIIELKKQKLATAATEAAKTAHKAIKQLPEYKAFIRAYRKFNQFDSQLIHPITRGGKPMLINPKGDI